MFEPIFAQNKWIKHLNHEHVTSNICGWRYAQVDDLFPMKECCSQWWRDSAIWITLCGITKAVIEGSCIQLAVCRRAAVSILESTAHLLQVLEPLRGFNHKPHKASSVDCISTQGLYITPSVGSHFCVTPKFCQLPRPVQRDGRHDESGSSSRRS